MESVYRVSGMSCVSCAGRVEQAALSVDGVIGARVNLAAENVRVDWAAGARDTLLMAAVKRAGYELSTEQAPEEMAAPPWVLWMATLCSLPLIAPMLGAPTLPAWWQFFLALPVQFGAGARFYRGAWAALGARTGNMDLLVALGTSAAFFLAVAMGLRHGDAHHLTFESAAVVITLVLWGKHFEARAKRRTGAAIRALERLRPATAWVRASDGAWREAPLAALRAGDFVRVSAGQGVPADGLITEGSGEFDEALITGEALPVPRAVGDAVIAGAVNGATTVVVQVTAVGEHSTLSRLIRAVEEAQSQRAPIQQLVDRVSAVFVPLVLLAAALTLLWWGLRSGDWERALVHAVTVLVIACPCALGLATPAAITVGSGAAARAGILIREPRALEGARAVKTVVFDKTGTLTTGTPRLAQLEFFGNDQAHIRGLLRALQEGQSHPLARAVALATNDAPSVTVRELRVLPGLGVEAQLGTDVVLLGNAKLLAARGLAPPADGALTGMGLSYLVVADQVRACLAFADELRPGAREAVAALQRQGKRVVILSGDRARAVQDMHEALGTDGFHAEIGPAEKARVIGEIAQQGPVAMVGDGINDAPALARADLGVAMGGASDVAMQAADITLLRPDPRLVSAALEIAALTQRKIRQNLFWAFAYNVVGIPLAMGGVLSPMYAGLAMALSSVSVVTNALWLGRWKGSRRIAAL